jgi:hypothetical protein
LTDTGEPVAIVVPPTQEATPATEGNPVSVVVPPTKKASPSTRPLEERREVWRGWLALTLMVLLSILALGLVAISVWLVRPFDRETVSLLIAGIFGPVVGLVGTVVGFYFGQISVSQWDANTAPPR